MLFSVMLKLTYYYKDQSPIKSNNMPRKGDLSSSALL